MKGHLKAGKVENHCPKGSLLGTAPCWCFVTPGGRSSLPWGFLCSYMHEVGLKETLQQLTGQLLQQRPSRDQVLPGSSAGWTQNFQCCLFTVLNQLMIA